MGNQPPDFARLKDKLSPVVVTVYDSFETSQRALCLVGTRAGLLDDIESWMSSASRLNLCSVRRRWHW